MESPIARLLKQYLDRALGHLRNDVGRELDALRAELAALRTRPNNREYEALTIAWEHFSEAAYATRSYMLPTVLPRDLVRLDDREISEFVDAMGLTAFDLSYVLKSANRNAACIRVLMIKKIGAAETAIWEARRAIRRQSVFFPAELTEQFDEAIALLQSIQSDSKAEYHADGVLKQSTCERLVSANDETQFRDLRTAVRDRLLA